MDMLNKVNLYSLGIIVNSEDLKNGSYGIVIEDFYPDYYIIENWTFEEGNEGGMTSLPAICLRPATDKEQEEFQKKWKKYIEK
ncbi:DUF2098 domain-containing protein [Candidatus Ornithobacterium hominis]|uniref:hypothetical protein n=1 Tax=Candidatus Ornithobacterium hominis TaxID=2497989 RepID=UPI0024BC5938|nr:hypothetical protein [Candidatus Ornithobacterium hominis]CAI9429313.1 DUF2098 domain-containing protein [Candidatus Ornithobacterium hominis]